MHKWMTAVITWIFVTHGTAVEAQLITRRQAKPNEPAPKAVLVQLPTYTKRINYLAKQNNQADIQQLKADADSMRKRLVADFSDNLNYCPVYYFYDTDLDKVSTGKLEGVLMNERLQRQTAAVITPADTTYVIIQFGVVAPAAPGKPATTDTKHRLQVYDYKYRKLLPPLPDGTNNSWGGTAKKAADTYKYRSPRFEIYYNPYVAQYNAKLLNFYGKYPY